MKNRIIGASIAMALSAGAIAPNLASGQESSDFRAETIAAIGATSVEVFCQNNNTADVVVKPASAAVNANLVAKDINGNSVVTEGMRSPGKLFAAWIGNDAMFDVVPEVAVTISVGGETIDNKCNPADPEQPEESTTTTTVWGPPTSSPDTTLPPPEITVETTMPTTLVPPLPAPTEAAVCVQNPDGSSSMVYVAENEKGEVLSSTKPGDCLPATN
jgi:hypothetical protein